MKTRTEVEKDLIEIFFFLFFGLKITRGSEDRLADINFLFQFLISVFNLSFKLGKGKIALLTIFISFPILNI